MNLRITFGMIVLNGEPFTRYNLRSLYPFAHQIIVVEGACPSAFMIATQNGHSLDGTLECLYDFKRQEDPEDKVIIVTAVDEGHINGFWSNKSEMSKAYAKRATGEYLWQVDSDEFYHEQHMLQVFALLSEKRPDAVSFPTISFWGNPRYKVEGFHSIRDNSREYHRLFAWDRGYEYATHFPPTVVDNHGRNLHKKQWIRAREIEKIGVHLYHYSLLFPQQVSYKTSYYRVRNRSTIDVWHETSYTRILKPFHVHNVYQHISWLERFDGEHPEAIRIMMNDLSAGRIHVMQRECADAEELLSRRSYVAVCRILSLLAHVMAVWPFNILYRIQASARFRLRRLLAASFRNEENTCGKGFVQIDDATNEVR